MRDHPPIPVTDLADNIDRLKANDGLKFSQEYEVSVGACQAAGAERCRPEPPAERAWKLSRASPAAASPARAPSQAWEPASSPCQPQSGGNSP